MWGKLGFSDPQQDISKPRLSLWKLLHRSDEQVKLSTIVSLQLTDADTSWLECDSLGGHLDMNINLSRPEKANLVIIMIFDNH